MKAKATKSVKGNTGFEGGQEAVLPLCAFPKEKGTADQEISR
jgi:hypothetical protein